MVQVSVNIPTCNRLNLLSRAVDSVRNQTFGDWEIILADNSGNDIVEGYVKELGDRRIKCFQYKMDGSGLAGARNFALEKSSGKYIAILDDDDEWCNRQKLAQQFSFLEMYPRYKVIGTNILVHTPDYKIQGEKKYPLSDEEIRQIMLVSCPFCHSSTLFKKEDIMSIGGYTPIKGAIENNEYLVWLEFGLMGKLANLPMQGVNFTIGHKKRNLIHNLKIHNENFKTIYAFRDKYPNIFKAMLKYAFVYPWNYAGGKYWEE
jgi:glycosyltransferase involved in cell wall biosynthesis